MKHNFNTPLAKNLRFSLKENFAIDRILQNLEANLQHIQG